MHIFLTGATGFIGAALVPELLAAGHRVTGLARSDAGAQALQQAGAQVHRGTLEDPASLASGTAGADAVIHAAFDHDFSRFVENCEKDRRVITALGAALRGTDRPLVITSGTGIGGAGHGRLAMEDTFDRDHPNPRIASELAGQALLETGVNVSVVRLPQVHNTEKAGLVSYLVPLMRAKGSAAYIGDGSQRWAAGHLSDVVKVFRLAAEKGQPGARYHAVGEEGVSAREMAEALGQGLGLPAISVPPEQAADYFGWMAGFAAMDMPASSARTQELLHWKPVGPGLIEDLRHTRFA